MMLSFCFAALVALASAKVPDAPGFDGFETAVTVATTADGSIRTTQIPGRIVIGRVDTTAPADPAGSRANVLGVFDVAIDDTTVCTQAQYVPIGGPPNGNTYGNVVVTTGDVAGTCVLTFTVSDSFRATSELTITITVEAVTDLDCVQSTTTLTPWSEECLEQEDGLFAKVRTFTTIQAQAGEGTACEDLPTFQNFTDYTGCDRDCVLASTVTFGDCDCTATSPTKSGTKEVLLSPRNNGTECGDNDVVTESCATECPIDCEFGAFEPWGRCSTTCGAGTRSRTRDIAVTPQNGGLSCQALCGSRTIDTSECLVEEEVCNADVACEVETDAPTAAPTAESTETCAGRCGFIGASRRPFLRANSEETQLPESKQFGRRRNRFRPIFAGGFRQRADVPDCSCDRMCARAIVGENTCCSDVEEECNFTPFPPISRPGPGNGGGFSGCRFKCSTALARDSCDATECGYYRGCDAC